MNNTGHSYLSARVLRLNIGFLLNDGPGHSHDSVLDFPRLRVSEDLILKYLQGPIRLSHTKEGMLVQAQLHAGIEDECYRCLNPVERDIAFKIEELYAFVPMRDIEFVLEADGILDLAPLIREEVLIQTSDRVLCRDDCKGLCIECGTNLNHTVCDCDTDHIDPRFEQLKQLLKPRE